MLENSPLVISDDGSHTILHSVFNVPYHSLRGSIQESNVVFINACLSALAVNGYETIDIFEMGFGTGLNAFLSYQWAEKKGIRVRYTGIEAYPLDADVVTKLNYPEILGDSEEFYDLHSLSWDQSHNMGNFFSLQKMKGNLEEFSAIESFDGIYYDAFAPSAQPDLWNLPMMHKMFAFLRPGGIFTTYCAQGQLRRNLQEAGFVVERLQGPPGKREMLRGAKPKNDNPTEI